MSEQRSFKRELGAIELDVAFHVYCAVRDLNAELYPRWEAFLAAWVEDIFIVGGLTIALVAGLCAAGSA